MQLFLVVLRPVVYSGSTVFAQVALSLYGLICSIPVIPRKRFSTLKSLLNYGVAVVEKKLGSNKEK